MPFSEIIKFELRKAARSLAVELEDYFKKEKDSERCCTKQAYSRARMKIKSEGYIELNNLLLSEYYKQAPKLYKGYRLLSVDGCGIQLPNGGEILEKFGSVNNRRNLNQSWTTVVYDVLNNLSIDAQLNKYGESERKYAIDQFKKICEDGKQKKDIILADRGFPSLELFVELNQLGYNFIIRYNGKNFLKETRDLINSQEKDRIIDVPLRKGNKRSKNKDIKNLLSKGAQDKIALRIVKIRLDNELDEYLITSLLDRGKFTEEDFKHLYSLRWREEVYFDFLKNKIEIENFSGKTVETIRQDYYSMILVSNIHSLILSEAQDKLDEQIRKKPKLKYGKYKVNRNVTYGIMKNRIYRMLNEGNENWQSEYDYLVYVATRHKIAVIEGRKYKRQRKNSLKYPMNTRRAI